MTRKLLFALIASLALTSAAVAEDKMLNICSVRHYPTGEALHGDIIKATGIQLNRVDADDADILARLKVESAACPADAILLLDASRLWCAGLDDAIADNMARAAKDGDTDQIKVQQMLDRVGFK